MEFVYIGVCHCCFRVGVISMFFIWISVLARADIGRASNVTSLTYVGKYLADDVNVPADSNVTVPYYADDVNKTNTDNVIGQYNSNYINVSTANNVTGQYIDDVDATTTPCVTKSCSSSDVTSLPGLFPNSTADIEVKCRHAGGWNLRGHEWGCCGNYEGCCVYASLVCYFHDALCRCCRGGDSFCGPTCKPEAECDPYTNTNDVVEQTEHSNNGEISKLRDIDAVKRTPHFIDEAETLTKPPADEGYSKSDTRTMSDQGHSSVIDRGGKHGAKEPSDGIGHSSVIDRGGKHGAKEPSDGIGHSSVIDRGGKHGAKEPSDGIGHSSVIDRGGKHGAKEPSDGIGHSSVIDRGGKHGAKEPSDGIDSSSVFLEVISSSYSRIGKHDKDDTLNVVGGSVNDAEEEGSGSIDDVF